MAITPKKSRPYWTPEEAQQWLPEILRLAETQGPQRIETTDSIVTLTAEPLRNPVNPEGLSLGQWLVQNMPRGNPPLPIPDRHSPCACPRCHLELYDRDSE